MTQRNENSVLFSLGHLQQMALSSAGEARFSTPARGAGEPVWSGEWSTPVGARGAGEPVWSGEWSTPVGARAVRTTSSGQPPLYIPATVGSSPMLLAHRPVWPRWLAPVVIGMGALFVVFLVLATAVALRGPQQVVVAPRPVAAPVVAPVVAPTPPPPPTARASAAASLPTVTETAARPTEAVTQPTPAPKKKRAMVKKRKARRSRRRARRTRTQRRHHARSTRRHHAKAASVYRPARKLGDRELDDILNAASR